MGPERLAFYESDEPRAWFVQRIREQASREAITLTEFEERYLQATAQGNDQSANEMLDTLSRSEFDDFDKRIAGLIWRRYESDTVSDPNARETYQRAVASLASVDLFPNLGMFVNCVALEKSPADMQRSKQNSKLVFSVLIALVIAAMICSYLSR
jgi:hypothetical protein